MVYFGAHLRYSDALSTPQSYQLLFGSGRIPQSVHGTSGGTRPPSPPWAGYATEHSQIKTEHCVSFRRSLSTLKLIWCVIYLASTQLVTLISRDEKN